MGAKLGPKKIKKNGFGTVVVGANKKTEKRKKRKKEKKREEKRKKEKKRGERKEEKSSAMISARINYKA